MNAEVENLEKLQNAAPTAQKTLAPFHRRAFGTGPATPTARRPEPPRLAPVARGLGWLSLGLGLTQLFAPRWLSRSLGLEVPPALMRWIGIREFASGLGILTQKNPAPWLWARVAGDVTDLGLLGSALNQPPSLFDRLLGQPDRRLEITAASVCALSVLDTACALQSTRQHASQTFHAQKTLTINAPPQQLYSFWHNFERLPQFMNHLESVQVTDPTHSHWVAKAPAGQSVHWDAEIIEDQPNHLIAWRSLPGSQISTSGLVRFTPAPAGRGSILHVETQFRPPAGWLGLVSASLWGHHPQKQLSVDLHRFKQLMETGEIATTEGQSAGRPSSTSKTYDDWLRRGF